MNLIFLLFLCITQLNVPHISNGFKSERKIFSRLLENFSLQNYFRIAWTKCIEICKTIKNCKSVNFIHRSGFCQLNTVDQADRPEALKERIGYVYSTKSDWDFTQPAECLACSDAESCNTRADNPCTVVGCLDLDHVPGTTILGNFFHIGAKRLYKCDNYGEQEVIVCQQDGSWSQVSLSCSTGTCARPEVENANVNVTENLNGITEATILCNTGFFHRSMNKIQCNSGTLEWVNLEEVGCIEISVDSWTIIYRTVYDTTANSVINSWNSDGKQEAGEFRYDQIISSWEETSFDSVKVEIKDLEDDTVKYLIFNRTNTNNKKWFSQDKILNSSWADLSESRDVRFFKITGVKFHSTGQLRWIILNAEDENKGQINCTSDLVWFAMTKPANYPCTPDRDLPGRVMVYSKSSTGTTWEGGQLRFAKEIIVSVHVN